MSFRAQEPITIPPFPLKPTTDVSREAARLWAEVENADAAIKRTRHSAAEAIEAVHAAKKAIDAEIRRSIDGTQLPAEGELLRAVENAKAAASPELHERRYRAAVERQVAAVSQYRTYVMQNAEALLNELKPDAEAVTAKLTKARDALGPLREAYLAQAYRAEALVAAIVGSDRDLAERWTVNRDEFELPLPDSTVVAEHTARWHAALHPQTVVVPEGEPVEALA
jgi:hypothetical protein